MNSSKKQSALNNYYITNNSYNSPMVSHSHNPIPNSHSSASSSFDNNYSSSSYFWDSSSDEFFEASSNPMDQSPAISEADPGTGIFSEPLIGFDSSNQVSSYEDEWGDGLVSSVLDPNPPPAADSISGIDEVLPVLLDYRAEKRVLQEDPGEELANLLVACAEAVSAKSVSLIHYLLSRLGELASPDGGTPMERLAAYFTEGLACRVVNDNPEVYRPLQVDTDPSPGSASSTEAEEEAVAAFHTLNHITPLVKFAHFTANDSILRAFEGQDRVHVIDLEVGQGLQWPALFQGLVARPGGPPSLIRITGIGPFKDGVEETGERIQEFARMLGLNLEFHPVIERIEDIRLWMLHVKVGEAVAVNAIGQLHRSLQTWECMRGVLEIIRSTRPVVVVLVEQEAGGSNSGCFRARFAACLRYYAALFDAVDASVEQRRRSGARSRIERIIFGREIRNIVGCDGAERIERHEGFEEWGRMMRKGGFRSCGLGKNALVQARLLLFMFPGCKEYRIIEGGAVGDLLERITLAWADQPLWTVSAWSPEEP